MHISKATCYFNFSNFKQILISRHTIIITAETKLYMQIKESVYISTQNITSHILHRSELKRYKLKIIPSQILHISIDYSSIVYIIYTAYRKIYPYIYASVNFHISRTSTHNSQSPPPMFCTYLSFILKVYLNEIFHILHILKYKCSQLTSIVPRKKTQACILQL